MGERKDRNIAFDAASAKDAYHYIKIKSTWKLKNRFMWTKTWKGNILYIDRNILIRFEMATQLLYL